MRTLVTRCIVVMVGVVLCVPALFGGASFSVSAHPLLNITGVPTEPAPPTSAPTQPPPPPPTSAPVENTAVPPDDQPPSSTEAPAPTSVTKGDTTHRDHDLPDIAIKKTIDQSSAAPGDLLGFTLHVTNNGKKTAENVVVTDVLPDYLDLLDTSTSKGTVSVSGRTVTVNIDTVAPGEYVTVHIRAYLNGAAPATFSNTGTVSNSNGDSDTSNNSSTAGFPVNKREASPTPVPPTVSPSIIASPPVVTAIPTATPPRPAQLPPTGESGSGHGLSLLIVGLSVIVLGLCLRLRVRRQG